MSTVAAVIPPSKARELEYEDARARRERRTGHILVRLVYYKGEIKRAAVATDFEDDIPRAGIMAPVCFESEDGAA